MSKNLSYFFGIGPRLLEIAKIDSNGTIGYELGIDEVFTCF